MDTPVAQDALTGAPLAALSSRRTPRYGELLAWTCAVGAGGGVVAVIYYYLLEGSMTLLWTRLLPERFGHGWWLPLVTACGGALVGASLRWLGKPGEISAVVNNIHMEGGRIDVKQTPSMIVASLLSITFGGSAGPEAPLVQINGSFGSWLADRLGLSPELVRTLTFCGMGAALGAFFGAPLGGALFALEIPHRRGLEYYEAIVPATIASLLAYLVFRGATGLSFGALYHLDAPLAVTGPGLGLAFGLGLFGALIATLFVLLFRTLEHAAKPIERWPILLGALGGACIGGIALVYPQTLFFGEHQGKELLENGVSLGALALFGLALAKMLAVGCTLHSGFRGGFIFPLFFIGCAAGLGLSCLFPQIPAPLAALCTMAAVNVAITKTPIATTVILTTLSGYSILPLLLVASFASFLATTRISLIRTQRSRTDPRLAASEGA